MVKRLTSILRTGTVRQSLITTLSIFLSSGLGAIYYLVLARTLGPHDYGLFSLAIAALSIVMSVSDLGIGQGLVKFVGANREGGNYFPFVKLAFRTKLIIGLLVTALFGVGATPIARTIFHQPELGRLLPVVGLAVLFQLLFFFSASIFQGLQKFTHWGGLQVGANVIRLVLLGTLIYFAKLSSLSALLIFAISYLVVFVISLHWIESGWLKVAISAKVKKDFWDFNRWNAVFVVLASITARLDTVLTGRLLSLTDVGIYALALTMVSFLPQLASAIGAVTAAKFAGMTDKKQERAYLKKSLFFVVSVSTLIALVMIPVAWMVIRITGAAYSGAMVPFLILLAGNVIFLATNPIRDSILFFHSKPKFFVFLSIVMGVVILTSGVILIPIYGVVGVAICVVINQLVCATLSTGYYLSLKS